MELAPHGGAAISRLGETRGWGSLYAAIRKPSSLLDEVSYRESTPMLYK